MRKLPILLVIFLAWLVISHTPGGEKPTPSPDPAPGELDLSGAFVGDSAAHDAAIVSSLAGELADVIEFDEMQSEPLLTTGIKLDELRKRSREFRCDGECLSDKHPVLAQRVGEYLDEKLGNSGGPVSPAQLSKWVTAYREIERAAARVIR